MRDNGILLLTAFALGVYVYGYDITHFSLSMDEENATLNGVVLPYLTQGRWGISLVRTLFLPDAVLPFFAAVNTVALLSLTGVLAAHMLRLTPYARFIFVALFMAFPQFAYVFQFSFLSESMALGLGLGLVSLILFQRFMDERRPAFFAGSVALGVLCTGIYQSLLFIPVTMFLLLSLQASMDESWNGKQYMCRCLWFALYGKSDILMANRLVQRMYDVCPDLDARRIPVHLAGKYPSPFRKLRRSQTFGSSFFDLYPETATRALTFMNVVGIARLESALSLNQEQAQALTTMPAWPSPKAVRLVDDVILVKLSEEP